MTELIENLYYAVEERVGERCGTDPQAAELLEQRRTLQNEIARRLGPDAWELLETLSAAELALEDIHDLLLFRSAMRLGTQIARPDRRRLSGTGAHSTSL